MRQQVIITVRKRSLRRLCFHRCLSVHRRGSTWEGTHPPQAGTPTPLSLAGTPPWQVHPLGRYPPVQVHPQATHLSPLQVHPQAGTPPREVSLPVQVHPQAGTPLGAGTPPPQCMLGYGQQVGGTHPTGMHCCSLYVLY